jgi:putative ABC transport system permease protein
MHFLWISGIVKRRYARLAGAFVGVTLTVALLVTLAIFLVGSGASMTKRAVSDVPIDWQVEAVPSADTTAIESAILKAVSVKGMHQVRYAQITGFEATNSGTVQVTGPGKVIAFDKDYLKTFPHELRTLTGDTNGVLIAQQTAANLHVGPGDSVAINRIGLPAVTVVVRGVVDLPDADALFQGVGLPSQAAPQAPPDNVLILPLSDWDRLFDPQQAARPDTTRLQFHVRLVRDTLPTSPTDAYLAVEGASKNLEAQVAGQALVSNNLGSRLNAVRSDALYATVLFLFLGVPGVVLACALTVSVAATGDGRRRTDQGILRVRGATTMRIITLASMEALVVGIFGSVSGLVLAFAFGNFFLSMPPMSWTTMWPILASALLGGLIVLAALLVPTWKSVVTSLVSAERREIGRKSVPMWQYIWLDVVLLFLASLLFWQSASTGYQVVLAPEGVPAAAVDYKAFLSPLCFWVGAVLFSIRLSAYFLSASNPLLWRLLLPVAGKLSRIVAASLAFQARRLTLGIAMTALAASFATSTAIFNSTYNGQARIDAELTNGADVTLFGTNAHPAGEKLPLLAKLPGVVAIQPMQHRFAYVGADLQDMYGIDPYKIGMATSLSNSYFSGGSAKEMMDKLAATQNGVLVSEETVSDFQLQEGDTINLRLISAKDNQYHPVPFTFIGVAREFPTAPRDSFLVANASYIAAATSSNTEEYLLMRASDDPAALAQNVRDAIGHAAGLQVKDIGSASHIIGSSLTAVDLRNLTVAELSFAVVMAVAAAGLMLGLGFLDRRRNFAILTAIGAKQKQLAAFLWSEGLVVILGGILFGLISGTITAWMLVKLLTGVFDPAPDTISVPWSYTGLVLGVMIISVIVAVILANANVRAGVDKSLRDL